MDGRPNSVEEISHRAIPRRRGHGCDLRRQKDWPGRLREGGRSQTTLAGIHQPTGVSRPVLPRGQDFGHARPPEHRSHLRPGEFERSAVHRHGVRARGGFAHHRLAGKATQTAIGQSHLSRRTRNPGWAGLCARPSIGHGRAAWDHPPRSLAVQYPVFWRRRGEAVRFRHRQGRDLFVRLLPRARQGGVHVARDGA